VWRRRQQAELSEFNAWFQGHIPLLGGLSRVERMGKEKGKAGVGETTKAAQKK